MSSVFESGEERERERHEVERYSSSSSFFLNIKKNERNAVKCYINDDNNSEYRRGQLLFITFKTVFRFSGCSETLENRFFVYYLKQRDSLKNNKEKKKALRLLALLGRRSAAGPRADRPNVTPTTLLR